MKRTLTVLALALALGVYAPQVRADCGHCGGDGKEHAHKAGEAHEHCKCEGCDQDKENCACEKKADANCDCGKAAGDCECKKKE